MIFCWVQAIRSSMGKGRTNTKIKTTGKTNPMRGKIFAYPFILQPPRFSYHDSGNHAFIPMIWKREPGFSSCIHAINYFRGDSRGIG